MPESERVKLRVCPMLNGWNASRCSFFGPMVGPMSSWLEGIPSPERAWGPWFAIALAKIAKLCGNSLDGAQVAMAGIEGRLRLTGVFRDIPSERRIPDYGAHGVLRQ